MNCLFKLANPIFKTIAVSHRVPLHPRPIYVAEGSNITLPTCYVIGHLTPVVRWSKAYSQLPQGRAQNNNSALRLLYVIKTDSDTYQCSASNIFGSAARRTQLVVVTTPKFITKPPSKLQYSSQMLKHLCDFPLPNVDLGFAVISVLQNTRCSTLGREKGHFSKETCVRSKPREFSRKFGRNGVCFNYL